MYFIWAHDCFIMNSYPKLSTAKIDIFNTMSFEKLVLKTKILADASEAYLACAFLGLGASGAPLSLPLNFISKARSNLPRIA